MQKNNILLLLICSLVLISCDFQCSIGDTKKPSAGGKNVTSTIKTENGAVISNGINITGKGIKLKSATLKLENGERVSDDNMVGLNEKIILTIELDRTWTIENEKTFIGASEKISTSSGEVVLSAADLFSDYDESGVSPTDAKYIRLNAVITKSDVKVDYYLVTFRVWDKKGTAEINGNYKFYLKK